MDTDCRDCFPGSIAFRSVSATGGSRIRSFSTALRSGSFLFGAALHGAGRFHYGQRVARNSFVITADWHALHDLESQERVAGVAVELVTCGGSGLRTAMDRGACNRQYVAIQTLGIAVCQCLLMVG